LSSKENDLPSLKLLGENLAWKLSLALKGESSDLEKLLDSFTIEVTLATNLHLTNIVPFLAGAYGKISNDYCWDAIQSTFGRLLFYG
jgi:hypothetical protein